MVWSIDHSSPGAAWTSWQKLRRKACRVLIIIHQSLVIFGHISLVCINNFMIGHQLVNGHHPNHRILLIMVHGSIGHWSSNTDQSWFQANREQLFQAQYKRGLLPDEFNIKITMMMVMMMKMMMTKMMMTMVVMMNWWQCNGRDDDDQLFEAQYKGGLLPDYYQ